MNGYAARDVTTEVVFAVIGRRDQVEIGLGGKYQAGSAVLKTLFCVVRFEVVETMHTVETLDPHMSNRRLNCQSGRGLPDRAREPRCCRETLGSG